MVSDDEFRQLLDAARDFDARGQLVAYIAGWKLMQKRPGEVHLTKGDHHFEASTAVKAVTIMSFDDDPYGPLPVG
ncbi:MAG: hypothetical protein AAGE52_20440 [Myxococcota bacterium]